MRRIYSCKNKKSKWGAINKDYKTVLDFEYDKIISTPIVVDEKIESFKTINRKNKLVLRTDITFKDFIAPFSGYHIVQKGDRIGLVNTKGEVVFPLKSINIYPKKNNLNKLSDKAKYDNQTSHRIFYNTKRKGFYTIENITYGIKDTIYAPLFVVRYLILLIKMGSI